jgi:Tol biopolymer transport system component
MRLSSFGPYELVDLLGAGGMGEVYRARDPRLGRDVAIKVLPPQFTRDPDRAARFDREARLLASLNHPNIAAVYGIEEADGVRGLVLELVEGETLAERVRRSPLPPAETIRIARQLCDALDAAHEKGIVHRDLKPANIKITPDGTVKVLDFGLAKATADESAPDLSSAPTLAADDTRVGVVLGTVAYMSPEQARGHRVDKRTDIWAFGCVLFEMLTGRSPFAADTVNDSVARILEREPDWTALPATVAGTIQTLLRRCLEKDPKQRLRDIADARTELDASSSAAASPLAGNASRRGRTWLVAAGVTAAVLVVTALALMLPKLRSTPGDERVVRSAVLLPERQQLDRSTGTHPLDISPDGSLVVYTAVAGERQLFVRDLTAFEPRAIPGTTGAVQPFFSPDGKWIAFFAGNALHKVAVTGGTPLKVCDVPRVTRGGSWGADDTIVFAFAVGGLSRVPASGGVAQSIPNSDPAVWPHILPDARTVLFTTSEELGTIQLDGSNRRTLARARGADGEALLGDGGFNGARYVRTGHLVYGQGLSLLAVPFDVQSQRLQGEPIPIARAVARASGGGAVAFAVSSTGVLTYVPAGTHELVMVTRDGRATSLSADRDTFRMARMSPDGRRVAVVTYDESRRSHIWLYDVQLGTKVQLAQGIMPAWFPDSRRVAFGPPLLEREADGTGEPRMLLSDRDNRYPTSWSRDGRHLLFNDLSKASAAGNADIWVLTDGTPRPVLTTTATEAQGRFSPDDRWIAYQSNESGRHEVYVIRYPQLDRRLAVSANGGAWPVWSRDGREIFYRQGLAVMAAGFDPVRGSLIDRPRQLFEGPFVGAGGEAWIDVTTDGRFVTTRADDAALGRQINVVTNWFAELK